MKIHRMQSLATIDFLLVYPILFSYVCLFVSNFEQ